MSNCKNNKQAIKVAVVDFIPAWGDLEGNISRLTEAVKKAAEEKVDYAVFPETAVSGYLFSDFKEMAPYFDTIPGKTTTALLPILERADMYISVGIAEKDTETGLAYNSAVLLGPKGIIGVYRKSGLNSQDQKIFSPGDTGVKVFDTPVGRIALLICYDDTYWQYARIAALQGAQIIGWHSVSDRMMPDASPESMAGDHSTVSHVQHLSALNGVWALCATRSGIETNPITKEQLYYNGGSSIWAPSGHKVAQSPIAPPIEIDPGFYALYTAAVDLKEADEKREKYLSRRQPALYHPTLALHRSPTDHNATLNPVDATLVAAQWNKNESLLNSVTVGANELLVLPQFSALPVTEEISLLRNAAEKQGGTFEKRLCTIANEGQGYVVGSYPEISEDMMYHTVVLAGPNGTILGRYRTTHLDEQTEAWATAGERVCVVKTPIGRIALAAAHELSVPELGGVYAILRADIIAAPAGKPTTLKVEIAKELYAIDNPPTGRADYYPYATATLNQLWVVCGGRRVADFSSAAIYGPEPVMLTPTLIAENDQKEVRLSSKIPAPYTWINQQRLIDGYQTLWFKPLVL